VTVTDFLDKKRQEINKRLAELKPLAEEYQQLQAAAKALSKIPAAAGAASSAATPAASPVKATRKKPGRPKGSGKKVGRPPGSAKAAASPAKRRAGRRKGSGLRGNQALSLVQGQPGITIPELAAKMGIKQNYLYRVLPGLKQEKKVEKKGRGWHPKAA
jgi:hypothetical protein